jgi:MFS family permease
VEDLGQVESTRDPVSNQAAVDAGAGERVASFGNPELQSIFAITLIAVLGVSTVSPALPRIITELGITKQQAGLLITIFTLPGVILTPLLGVLADRFGRKLVIIPALLLFGIAGSACALARSFELLLLLRFMQGIGAAPLGSLNVTLIGDLFNGRQRIAAMGYNAAVLSAGTAIYPAIGGAVAMLGWFYPFALPIFALPVAGLVMLRLKAAEPRRQQKLSRYLGEVWCGIWKTEMLVLFLASLVIFILLYGAYLMYFSLLMDDRFSASPLAIGLVMSVVSIMSALSTSQLGRLARLIPERIILRWGFVILAIGLAGIPLAPGIAFLLIPSALLGVAFATTIPPIQSIIAGLAPTRQRAAFMSLNGMVLRLGQTAGPLVASAIHIAWGLDAVFITGAVSALAMVGMLIPCLPPALRPDPPTTQ